jgi:spermidine synthase
MSNLHNHENIFWEIIKKSGKNGNKINKIRKIYKNIHGKLFIDKIDTIFHTYYSKIFSKFESQLGRRFDEDEEGVRDLVFYILSKGKQATNDLINSKKIESKLFKDIGKITIVLKRKKTLFSKQSKYQMIEVFNTKEFGNVLTIDNDINVTELDEKNYHEMIVHVPMVYKQNAKKALVIGGGDGGTARELLKYQNLDVTMVEIDEVVIEAAKLHLPSISVSFSNPRLNLLIQDGSEYIKNYNGEKFDLIIVDSTDFNQAIKLFTIQFYKNIKKNLKSDGIFVFNNDSVYSDKLKLIYKPVRKMKSLFKNVFPYQIFIPTYNGGHYTMMFCSDTIHPINNTIDFKSWCKLNLNTDYYNLGIHLGSFFLPNNLSKKLNDKLNPCLTDIQNKDKMCYHSLIDLYNVDFNILNKINLLMPILKEIAKMVNLTILKESYHEFKPQGLTAMLLLSESHISIHTWPEKNSACLDILSCKNNPADYINNIIHLFNTKKYKFKNITR